MAHKEQAEVAALESGLDLVVPAVAGEDVAVVPRLEAEFRRDTEPELQPIHQIPRERFVGAGVRDEVADHRLTVLELDEHGFLRHGVLDRAGLYLTLREEAELSQRRIPSLEPAPAVFRLGARPRVGGQSEGDAGFLGRRLSTAA